MRITVHDLRRFKDEGHRFVLLTAYDFPTAQILDEAGVQVILVGDTLSIFALGHDTTIPVTMEEMLHHGRAAARGVKNALLVGDLPFGSYGASIEEGVRNAGRYLKEAGAQAVKLEGPRSELVEAIASVGIPVMGHLGLTPQSEHKFGGYKVQARTGDAAQRLIEDAQGLEAAGAFAIVLEAVPSEAARRVTRALRIPTIGVGAGPHCDGHGMVTSDALGLGAGRVPRFAKDYGQLRERILAAAKTFVEEVASSAYPDPQHSYDWVLE